MSIRLRVCTLSVVLFALAQPATLHAGVYSFTGTVTSIDDPFGALLAPAHVGASVSGSFVFTYSTAFDENPFFSPQIAAYTNDRSSHPELTNLSLSIGGVTNEADPESLTNVFIGDNAPVGPDYAPQGDFFRYLDYISYPTGPNDGLADYYILGQNYNPYPLAQIILNDPTGTAFNSQELPQGPLPLSSFTNNYGSYFIDDANGDYQGNLVTINFRIDSIRSVPEPSSIVLLVIAVIPALGGRIIERIRQVSIAI